MNTAISRLVAELMQQHPEAKAEELALIIHEPEVG
jgi:hypothetical protein